MASGAETIPLAARVAWLRASYGREPVTIGPAVPLGRPLPERRAGLVCRVVVLGAESTGTSTVAQTVADHYRQRGGVWARTSTVGEYGRDYTQSLWDRQRARALASGRTAPALTELVWGHADFDAVAARQTELEEEAARSGSPLLVCDTDALATSIWERRYLGPNARRGQWWARPPARPRHDLYLLTSHVGVAWIDDGIREGDLATRAAMTDWFADALTVAGLPWVTLEGPLEQRASLALRSIDPILRRRLSFAAPLSGPGFPSTTEVRS
jgi:HTH-type transcriptional repressor of NAD biosynthesis genes